MPKYLIAVEQPVVFPLRVMMNIMDQAKLSREEAETALKSNHFFEYDEEVYCRPIEEVEASFKELDCIIKYEPIEL